MDAQTPLDEQVNLLSRLDRIPIKRSLWIIIVILALAWIIEGFDTSIISPAVVFLAPLWHLTASQTGIVATVGTLGVVIGLIPAGRLADKYGRRKVLCWGISIFCVATFGAGFAQNLSQFATLRFIAGLAEGAVFPVPYLMLSEFSNRRQRAFTVGCALLGLSLGNTFPTLVTRLSLATYGVNSWRVPLVLGGLLILIVPAILIWVPESPRYLLRKGRTSYVKDLIERWESQAHLRADENLVEPDITEALSHSESDKGKMRQMFKVPYLSRSAIAYAQLLAAFIGFYLFSAYGPSILKILGATTANAFLFSAIGGWIGGLANFLQGALADRFGRRAVQGIYVGIQVIGLVVLGLHAAIWVLGAAYVVYNFGAGNFTLGKLYVAEQYPTSLRSTGAATGETLSRFLAGVVLAFFIPSLLKAWGPLALFVVLGLVMLILVAPMVVRGRETANISVDVAGSDLSLSSVDGVVSVTQPI